MAEVKIPKLVPADWGPVTVLGVIAAVLVMILASVKVWQGTIAWEAYLALMGLIATGSFLGRGISKAGNKPPSA